MTDIASDLRELYNELSCEGPRPLVLPSVGRILIERVSAAEQRVKELENQVARQLKDLILRDCKNCGGTGDFQDSTEGGIWAPCHCWANRVNDLKKENAALRAKCERHERPVSVEEWLALCSGAHVQMADIQRHELNALIAARAAEPEKP